MICARAAWRVDSVGAHREGRRLKWLSTRASMLYIVIRTPVCVTVTVLCCCVHHTRSTMRVVSRGLEEW